MLEILREEGATFSLLSEPERSEYETLRGRDLMNKIRIGADGEAIWELGVLGNVLCDRLGDLWEIKQMEARSHE